MEGGGGRWERRGRGWRRTEEAEEEEEEEEETRRRSDCNNRSIPRIVRAVCNSRRKRRWIRSKAARGCIERFICNVSEERRRAASVSFATYQRGSH